MSDINIKAGFERGLIRTQGNSVRYLVADINTPKESIQSPDSPVNIGLVIDASGSMRGEWIEAAKRAAIGIIDTLTSIDTVSVVSFASDVQVHCSGLTGTRDGKKTAKKHISGLSSRDTTDLSTGWLGGAECVAAAMSTSVKSQISSVILLSDGFANKGILQPTELAMHARELLKRGIASSAVGIGPNYSNLQLQAIADNGGGSLHHASRPQEIVEIVVAELRELRQVAAEDIDIEISTSGNVEIECLSEFPRISKPSWAGVRGHNTAFSLGSLISGASRNAVFKITSPVGRESDGIEFQVTARWSDPSDRTYKKSVAASTYLQFASDHENALQHVQQSRGERAARTWLGKTIREALELNETGHYQEAVELMRTQSLYFKRFCSLLENGGPIADEWDQALPHVGGQIDDLMAKETSRHYSRSSRNTLERRAITYDRAWNPVE